MNIPPELHYHHKNYFIELVFLAVFNLSSLNKYDPLRLKKTLIELNFFQHKIL